MEPLDYSQLIQRYRAEETTGMSVVDRAYADGDGLRLHSEVAGNRFSYDAVRLGRDAFLFASDCNGVDQQRQHQIVTQSDWVHIQFRLRGGGREGILGRKIETPEHSCILTRYPQNSLIERVSEQADRWQVVCLFMHPTSLVTLLDSDRAWLPESVRWLADQEADLQVATIPLQPAMAMAVSDIITCSYEGPARRGYMRAKSLELLVSALDTISNSSISSPCSVSDEDAKRIETARTIISHELEENLTLSQIGRRVGLNRTKLASGFKEIFGQPLQAYWRDVKLAHARQLLSENHSVTDVALSLGYAELSSFTRAFTRKYGVRPCDLKMNSPRNRPRRA